MKIIIIPNAPRMTARHYQIAKTLVELGHEVHYVQWQLPDFNPRTIWQYITQSLRSQSYTYEEFTMHSFRHLPYYWPLVNRLWFQKQLRLLFRHIECDLIFAEGYLSETEVPADLPFIYDLADDYAGWATYYGSTVHKIAFKLYGVSNTMKRQCHNAIAVTAVSKMLMDYAEHYNDNVYSYPNGVNSKTIKQILKRPKLLAPPHSLVYASGFGQWSHVIEVMEATRILRNSFHEITLRLIGDGTEAGAIKLYIDQHNASDYIEYMGFISDSTELYTLISQCRIGLNITDKNKWRHAAFPMKIIDYSALGMLVVATDLDEVMRLEQENIYTCNDDEAELRAIIEKALTSSRQSFPDISATTLKKYDWKSLTVTMLEQVQRVRTTRNNQ